MSPFLMLLGTVSQRSADRGNRLERPVEWAFKIIEDIYDEKYRVLSERGWKYSTPATFVFDYISRQYGVKGAVDQMCFDLHRMCELYRGDEPQMNLFACFLDESFDSDDLCFLVEAREKCLLEHEKCQRSTRDAGKGYSDLKKVMLPMSRVGSLVDEIFGLKAPSLSARVVERLAREVPAGRKSLSVSRFLIAALEEFRIYFGKPFPRVPQRDPRKQEERHELEDRRKSKAELVSSERHYRIVNEIDGHYAGELMTRKLYQQCTNPGEGGGDGPGAPHDSISLHDRREWGEEPIYLDSKSTRRPAKPFRPSFTSPSRTSALGVQEPTRFFAWQ